MIGAIGAYAVGFYLDNKRNHYYGIVRFFLVVGLMLALVYIPIYAVITGGEFNLAQRLFMAVTSLNLTILLFVSDIINHTLWHTTPEEDDDEE